LLMRTANGDDTTVHINGDVSAFSFVMHKTLHEVRNIQLQQQHCEYALDGTPWQATVLRHGDAFQVALVGEAFDFTLTSPFASKAARAADTATHPVSPMPGRVVAVHVKAGDNVQPGQALLVLEGMKMEYTVKAVVAGTIEKVLHQEGDMVDAEAPLVDIKAGD
jgi:3-methylcrotonyl-CoA carboxylase alpha subunit